jgi:DnaA family protein
MNQQLPLTISLNNEATLSDFCWGSNRLLQQQLLYALSGQGERFFYLWGEAGCGKSHLLQACCHFVTTTQTAIYLPLKNLQPLGPGFLDGIEHQTLICIDDVDSVAGNVLWEEGLFHLYNRVKANDRTLLLMTGDQPPSQIPILLRDLQSRLSWGFTMQIQALNDEDKLKTLTLHAHKRGVELSPSVGQFLLNRCSRNMHDLLHLLNQLDQASLAAQRKITIPFVKNILAI